MDTNDQDVPSVDALNDAFAAAFADNDFSAVAALYSTDAVMLPPRSRMIKGREGVEEFWRGLHGRYKGVRFTTVAVKPLGAGVAREVGTLTIKGEGEETQDVSGKYVVVWQKLAGQWEIESSIWNRRASGQGGRQGRPPVGGQGRRGAPQPDPVSNLYANLE